MITRLEFTHGCITIDLEELEDDGWVAMTRVAGQSSHEPPMKTPEEAFEFAKKLVRDQSRQALDDIESMQYSNDD